MHIPIWCWLRSDSNSVWTRMSNTVNILTTTALSIEVSYKCIEIYQVCWGLLMIELRWCRHRLKQSVRSERMIQRVVRICCVVRYFGIEFQLFIWVVCIIGYRCLCVWQPACCGDLGLVCVGDEVFPRVESRIVLFLISRCWYGTCQLSSTLVRWHRNPIWIRNQI